MSDVADDPVDFWAEDNGFRKLSNESYLCLGDHVWPREWLVEYMEEILGRSVQDIEIEDLM